MICTYCNEEKPPNLFSKTNGGATSLRCKKCAAEEMKRWRKQNPDRWKKIAKKTYQKQAEKRKAASRDYYCKNREKAIKAAVEWNRKNRKLANQYRLRYFKKFPEKQKAKHSHRLHRKRSNGNYKTVSFKHWSAIQEKYNFRCAYCGGDEKLTKDHVIPLSKGGPHAPENIVPACKSCNGRKQDQTGWEPRIFPTEILV